MQIFLEMFDALKKADSTAIVLSLMKLASCLERALGDVSAKTRFTSSSIDQKVAS